MNNNEIIKIETDIEKFQERVDEITGEISYERIKHIIAKIKKALYNNPDVVALCAPQVGENIRLFVVRTARTESERFKIFLNPIVISSEGLHMSREINASFPDKQFIIPRRDKIHVAYQMSDGQPNSESFIGALGEVVQQMIEMLDGITLFDYGLDLDDIGGWKAFDRATNDEKAEVLDMYLNQLKMYSTDLAKEIEENPTLNKMDKDIRFMTEVLKGNIKGIDDKGNIVDEEYMKNLAKKEAEKIAAEKGIKL